MRLASTVSGDYSVAKRLTMLVFACLRAAGTMKLCVEVPRFDVKMRDFYATLGFMPHGSPPPLVAGAVVRPAGDTGGSAQEACETVHMVRSF